MSVEIKGLISRSHEGDINQLKAIFSDNNRILLEAPAGCGKTKTMISKMIYVLEENRIPKNKKILGLTFSVNAAFKMKKDIINNLSSVETSGANSNIDLNKRVYISNYHGFSRHVLSLYGYILDEKLREINSFKSFNESKREEIYNEGISLTDEENEVLNNFSNSIVNCDLKEIYKLKCEYLSINL